MDQGPYVEIQSETGSTLLIPLAPTPGTNWELISRDGLIEESATKAAERFGALLEFFTSVYDEVRTSKRRPDSFDVEAVLKFGAEGSLVFAKTTGEVGFSVKAHWDLTERQ